METCDSQYGGRHVTHSTKTCDSQYGEHECHVIALRLCIQSHNLPKLNTAEYKQIIVGIVS